MYPQNRRTRGWLGSGVGGISLDNRVGGDFRGVHVKFGRRIAGIQERHMIRRELIELTR
jgi:hypothetical protein